MRLKIFFRTKAWKFSFLNFSPSSHRLWFWTTTRRKCWSRCRRMCSIRELPDSTLWWRDLSARRIFWTSHAAIRSPSRTWVEIQSRKIRGKIQRTRIQLEFFQANGYNYQDGKLFHYLYKRALQGSTVEQLCETRVSWKLTFSAFTDKINWNFHIFSTMVF